MALTPMMQQYMEMKNQNPDAILFFRLGDFYEMFFDDAITASKELEIVLTQRDAGLDEKAPMCGVPHHVVDFYLAKLVEKGYKVAICEQLEDPASVKGIVKRGIVKIETPGTFFDSSKINNRTNNYILSLYVDNNSFGISYLDYSTGEIFSTEYIGSNYKRYLENELLKIMPTEIIVNEICVHRQLSDNLLNIISPVLNKVSDDELAGMVNNQSYLFDDERFAMLEKNNNLSAKISFHMLYSYISATQKESLNHLRYIKFYRINDYMVLDYNTRINLELLENLRTGKKQGALLGVIDKTKTSLGARLLKKWIELPLTNIAEINNRLNYVETFLNDLVVLDEIRYMLRDIYDMERLVTRLISKRITPYEMICLKNSIDIIPKLQNICMKKEGLSTLCSIDYDTKLSNLIFSAINSDCGVENEGVGFIKQGYSKELDDLRLKTGGGKQFLINLETKERDKTGIKNLKIKYNKILGYYFDVTKSNLSDVPDYFIRKQTLVGSERYFTQELKEMENEILSANEKAISFERGIFNEIIEIALNYVPMLLKIADIIAKIDVLCSFAAVSYENNYIKPIINTDGIINIKNARHPVVEINLKNVYFVPNDVLLDNDKQTIEIITGPNMSGKSTYMRQVAVIVLMSHVGCFVPADSAIISIVDRIFTRIGASDNLSDGESTFMVEMNEVSDILANATDKSLIILDEVGRGTSTYDGLSIAWAIVEYLSNSIGAKTLFATHYHELTEIANSCSNVVNKTILVEERDSNIVFLRKIVNGTTDKSYGIEVARLAGIDAKILSRAKEILFDIEKLHSIKKVEESNNSSQIDFEKIKKENYLKELTAININNLTPVNSLVLLEELIEKAKRLYNDQN